jgi:transposase-like protein
MEKSRTDRLRDTDVNDPDRVSLRTTRWVASRKAEVVAAIGQGQLSADEACERYDITTDQLVLWQEVVRRDGLAGPTAKSIPQERQWRDRDR